MLMKDNSDKSAIESFCDNDTFDSLQRENISVKEIEQNPERFKGLMIEYTELVYDGVPDGITFYVSDSKGNKHLIDVSSLHDSRESNISVDIADIPPLKRK